MAQQSHGQARLLSQPPAHCHAPHRPQQAKRTQIGPPWAHVPHGNSNAAGESVRLPVLEAQPTRTCVRLAKGGAPGRGGPLPLSQAAPRLLRRWPIHRDCPSWWFLGPPRACADAGKACDQVFRSAAHAPGDQLAAGSGGEACGRTREQSGNDRSRWVAFSLVPTLKQSKLCTARYTSRLNFTCSGGGLRACSLYSNPHPGLPLGEAGCSA